MNIGLDFAVLTVILRFITLSYFDEFDSDFNDIRSLKPRGNEEVTCSTTAVKWNKNCVFDVRNAIEICFRETMLAGSRVYQGARQARASGHTLANSVRPQ